jgi:aerobic carbon-monoxide dehydrogenase medium subunit
MFPASFDYSAPDSLDEVLALLAKHGDGARLLAGGHSLLPLMKLRLAQPRLVVDLRRVASLRGVRRESGALVIGAMTTYAELAASPDIRDSAPIVFDAVSRIGDPQVRNRGTIGGSLAHADPGADLPVVALATGASLTISAPNGTRAVSADDFFVDMYTTALAPNELLTDVRIPLPAARAGSAYVKHPHPATRFAVIGVAATVELERMSDRVQRVRVAVTGFGGKPLRGIAAEEALVGRPLDSDAIANAADRLAQAGAAAIGGADEYKVQLARVYAAQALRKAAERAR